MSWLSRNQISEIVHKAYEETINQEPDYENKRSLDYIIDAVVSNQFGRSAEQVIYDTFGFEPDMNTQLSKNIAQAIKTAVQLNNKSKEIILSVSDGWYRISYSTIIAESLSKWVIFEKEYFLWWVHFKIEVGREKVPWEDLVTEYLWVRYSSGWLTPMYWSIDLDNFQSLVEKLESNIWDNNPATLKPTELFNWITLV